MTDTVEYYYIFVKFLFQKLIHKLPRFKKFASTHNYQIHPPLLRMVKYNEKEVTNMTSRYEAQLEERGSGKFPEISCVITPSHISEHRLVLQTLLKLANPSLTVLNSALQLQHRHSNQKFDKTMTTKT